MSKKGIEVVLSLPIAEDGSILRTPSTAEEAGCSLVVLQDRYETAQLAYREAADAFYAHDAKGKLVEVECVEDLIASGTTKTDAAKLAKVQPKYLTHQDKTHELASKRDNAEVVLSIARRRYNTMTTMAYVLFPSAAVGLVGER